LFLLPGRQGGRLRYSADNGGAQTAPFTGTAAAKAAR